MPIKLKYIGFNQGNPDFHKTDTITRFFKPDDAVVNNINDANILLIGDYVNNYDVNAIQSFNKLKIQYIAEPIMNLPYCPISKYIYQHNLCSFKIGCVPNSPEDRCIKYPLYLLFPNLSEKSTFTNVNEYVNTCDIHNKKFCVLINRHDMGNTRTPIHNKLNKFDRIDCFGRLLNNCSNVELNVVGIPEYVKKYKFIICTENYYNDHPGYITEKILNACLSGAIPIYNGIFDLIDLEIFNVDRILQINPTNVDEIANRVKYLIDHPDDLENFYRQPVFKDTACETIANLNNSININIDMIRKSIM